MDAYEQALRAIDAALTPKERKLIELRHGLGPWRGASFDDLLESLVSHDAFCGRTDPFFDEHGSEVPDGPLPGSQGGATVSLYAAYAVLAMGGELTVEAVTGLMARAGLVPKFDVQAAAAELAETIAAIKAQDAREDDLKRQLGINKTERARNFRHIAAIFRNATDADLTQDDWRTLIAGQAKEVSRACTVTAIGDL